MTNALLAVHLRPILLVLRCACVLLSISDIFGEIKTPTFTSDFYNQMEGSFYALAKEHSH